jgi:hypothetical protein
VFEIAGELFVVPESNEAKAMSVAR